MLAFELGCACVGGTGWLWENMDDPLQASCTTTTIVMGQSVRNNGEAILSIENWPNARDWNLPYFYSMCLDARKPCHEVSPA
jgi:hypothetical protein